MPTDTVDAPPALPAAVERPLRPIWIWLALIFTALCVIQGGHQLWRSAGLPTGLGRTGISWEQSCASTEFCPIIRIAPGSPAERAGLQPGDRLRPENPIDQWRGLWVGETRPYIQQTASGERPLILTADKATAFFFPQYIVSSLTLMLAGLMGGLVIARSQGRRALVLIGLAYASFAITGQWPRMWQSTGLWFVPFYVVLNVIYYGSPLLFLAGARALRKEVSGRDTLGIRLGFWGLVAVQGTTLAWQLHAEMTGRTGLFGENVFLAYALPVFIGYVLAAAVLAMAWRESAPEHRSRYGIMLVAIGCTFLAGVFDMGILLTGNDYLSLSPLLISWYVAFLAGTALFGYAILRHRVIDLGFAVNRTLVYGVLSTVLLFGFWFCEWGLEEIIPAETREANILISAGIAFVIFLTFHHVRDWVEKAIEHLFFRTWRDNDARLKRFLREAAFVTRPEALRDAAVAEFSRFGQGAAVAFYEVDADGMALIAGGSPDLPERLAVDAQVMVRLRAGREALQDDPALPEGAALALPTLYRNELTGAFLLSAKPDEAVWRPDEKALLAEAALRIGLDLHALAVEALKAEKARESQRADILAAELRQALAGRPAVA
ncbi:hypothetical protein IFJ75_12105 [Brevundimonas goettingensis]|uniref:Histidine kinase N-terminal 7TM region domain-containing protein n=2 Tax=Brevundimonas goettingensis TaxID=2774190 RepID=A0A975C1F8_9CAUL|nr:hypothetical protein IFJ75_12105 [Brevundimonas goettingensis]